MSVKISPKYQVGIPEEVRRSLDLRPGMQMEVIALGTVAYMVPIRPIDEVRARIRGKFSREELRNFREKKDRKI